MDCCCYILAAARGRSQKLCRWLMNLPNIRPQGKTRRHLLIYGLPHLSQVDDLLSAGEAKKLTYSTFGAACTEVEINLLTGERRVLRSDVLHDAGHSISPAVDMGQVR